MCTGYSLLYQPTGSNRLLMGETNDKNTKIGKGYGIDKTSL